MTAASSKDFKIPLTAAGLPLTGISEELISHRENKHWLCIVFAAEEATGGREQFTALPVSWLAPLEIKQAEMTDDDVPITEQ